MQSFLSSGANSSAAQQNSTGFALPAAHKNSTSEAKAIGNLVAGSVQLGADLAESGHAVSLAAEERVSARTSWTQAHVHVLPSTYQRGRLSKHRLDQHCAYSACSSRCVW